MSSVRNNSLVRTITRVLLASVLTLSLALMGSSALYGKDKKKDKAAAAEPASSYKDNRKFWETLDLSKIVWPNPPAITRIKYLSYWSGEKFVEKKTEKKKASWMERVSGVATGETVDTKPRWQLVVPNGLAVDSKGLAYIADSKVRAIFIVNTETGSMSAMPSRTWCWSMMPIRRISLSARLANRARNILPPSPESSPSLPVLRWIRKAICTSLIPGTTGLKFLIPTVTSSALLARPVTVPDISRDRKASRLTATAMSGSLTRCKTACRCSHQKASC